MNETKVKHLVDTAKFNNKKEKKEMNLFEGFMEKFGKKKCMLCDRLIPKDKTLCAVCKRKLNRRLIR